MTAGGSGREGGRALKVRVKMTRKRTVASARWLERQLNDPYVAQANDARKRVDDPESLSGRPRDQQPTIVGSEIQRRISPAPAIARAGRAFS